MQGDGQGFNAESDGQRKEEGLKWFSRADLQSAEVSSRRPEPSSVEPFDAGRQDLSVAQGQGGAPSTGKSSPAQASAPSPQASRLSPDPETAPAPTTHSVQFDLAPADFGQLRVRLVLADQTVHTHMSTDRAELGQMLTSQQEQLTTQLSGAGLDLGRFQVQVDQERSNQPGQEWQSQAQGGASQQQRDQRQQDRAQDAPVPAQARTGMLSLFA
jgi:flagellar hook-length control protein FliK